MVTRHNLDRQNLGVRLFWRSIFWQGTSATGVRLSRVSPFGSRHSTLGFRPHVPDPHPFNVWCRRTFKHNIVHMAISVLYCAVYYRSLYNLYDMASSVLRLFCLPWWAGAVQHYPCITRNPPPRRRWYARPRWRALERVWWCWMGLIGFSVLAIRVIKCLKFFRHMNNLSGRFCDGGPEY